MYRICIVLVLGRDIGCRHMGNGSARLVVAAVAVVFVVVAADVAAADTAAVVKVDVDVGVAEVVPGRPAAEAAPEAGSSNTCPSLCCYRRLCSVIDRRCRDPYLS